MSFYTITIAPDDPRQATATVRVKITDSDVRIEEVVMRAGDRSLTARALQSIDLDLLARAVVTTGATTGKRAAPTARKTAAPIPAADVEPARRLAAVPATAANAPAAAGAGTGATRTPAPSRARATNARSTPAAPAVKSAPSASSTAPAAGKDSVAIPPRSAGSQQATRSGGQQATRSGSAKAAAPAATAGGGRTYRRAPDDLADVWRQASTVTAVADHYDVPRHTASSWVRTLKRDAANA
jgi:hypothetical protein